MFPPQDVVLDERTKPLTRRDLSTVEGQGQSKSFRAAWVQLMPGYASNCVVCEVRTDAELHAWLTQLNGPDETRAHEWDNLICPNDPNIFIHRWTSMFQGVRAILAVEYLSTPFATDRPAS